MFAAKSFCSVGELNFSQDFTNERCGIASLTEYLLSLTELVIKRRNASPLIKPFFVLKRWQDEKLSVYSVGLKWVCESRILRVKRRGPLNTSVSRIAARSDDISPVNLIVGWKELGKLRKMETSCTGMFHKENMSSINLF